MVLPHSPHLQTHMGWGAATTTEAMTVREGLRKANVCGVTSAHLHSNTSAVIGDVWDGKLAFK